MEEGANIFDKNKSFSDEFRKKYGRVFDIPIFKTLKACFHPTLSDHIVTLNEISFPKVSGDKISTLVHDRMQGYNFLDKIETQYMPKAENIQAKRRKKLAQTITFRKDSEDSGSIPQEPDSDEWEDSSVTVYEGGKENDTEDAKSPEKTSPKKKKAAKLKRYKVNRNNEIFIDMPPKVKGAYPRIPTKTAEDKIYNEKMKLSEVYNRAVDIFMEEENVFLTYQNFDESMKPDIPENEDGEAIGPNRNYGAYLYFNKLPEYQGSNYVPPPFRHKYELCIWKIDSHNVAKIKNKYFTPEMLDEEQGFNFDIDISLDNQTLVLVDHKVVEDKKMILIFDLYTLDKIAEFPVNVCNRVYLDYDDYDDMYDSYSPEFAISCKTKYNFPRVH